MKLLYFTIGLMLAILVPLNANATVNTPENNSPTSTSSPLTDPNTSNEDKFCTITRNLANSPIGPYMELEKYEDRCGSGLSQTSTTNQAVLGLKMASCALNSEGNSFESDTKKEECDNLMLDVSKDCDNGSDATVCRTLEEVDIAQSYIERENLEPDNEDNDNEDKEEEEDN
jgi:hypothetical protein